MQINVKESTEDLASDIINAITLLNNFNNDLKNPKFRFNSDNLHHISGVTNYLNELNEQRLKIRDQLESESICAAQLRLKLKRYPDEINDDIKRCVEAARGLNVDRIQELETEIKNLTDESNSLLQQIESIQLENSKLLPDRDQTRKDFHEIVLKLNLQLSSKADEQIDLNSHKDMIRNCNQRIIDLEEKMLELKDNLIKERAEAKQRKLELANLTNENNEKKNAQNSENEKVRKELDDLKHQVTESQIVIDNFSAAIRKLDKAISELTKTRSSLTNEINLQEKTNKALRDNCEEIEKETQQMKREFDLWMAKTNDEIIMLDHQITDFTEKEEEEKKKGRELKKELDNERKLADANALRVQNLKQELTQMEEEFTTRTEDINQLEQEIVDFETTSISLQQSHEATVNLLKRNIDELKNQLNKERGDKNDVQKTNNDLQDEINKFRAKHGKFMREMNAKLNEGKSEHSRLTNEQSELTRAIKTAEALMKSLKVEFEQSKVSFRQADEDGRKRISELESDIESMKQKIEFLKGENEQFEPEFQKILTYNDQRTAAYDNLKKELIALKNEKSRLQDIFTRKTRDLDKTNRNKETLSEKIEQVKQHAHDSKQSEQEELMAMEKQVYATGCKLKVVKQENAKLIQGTAKYQTMLDLVNTHWPKIADQLEKLQTEKSTQLNAIESGWKSDEQLFEQFGVLDEKFLRSLEDLLQRTEVRGDLVSDITDNMRREINSFSNYLHLIGTVQSASDEKPEVKQ